MSAAIPPHGSGQQTHIARNMSVSQEAVRKWFAGDSQPKAQTMRKLAKLLNVEYVWLSLGEAEISNDAYRAEAKQQDSGVYAFASYLLHNGFKISFGVTETDTHDIVAKHKDLEIRYAVCTSPLLGDIATIVPRTIARGVTLIAAIAKNKEDWGFDFIDITSIEDQSQFDLYRNTQAQYTYKDNIYNFLI